MHKSEKSNQYSASTRTAALDFLSLTMVQESTYYSKVLFMYHSAKPLYDK